MGCTPDSVSRRVVREGALKAANEISFRVATRPLRTKLTPTGERPHPGDAHGPALARRAVISLTVASPQAGPLLRVAPIHAPCLMRISPRFSRRHPSSSALSHAAGDAGGRHDGA